MTGSPSPHPRWAETRAEMKHCIMRMGLADRNVVSLRAADASRNVEIDCISEPLERIEQRLELADR